LIALGAMAFLWSRKNAELNACTNQNTLLVSDMNGMNDMMSGYVGNMSNDLKKDFKNMLKTYDALIEKDASKADSLNIQKAKIQGLISQLNNNKRITASQLFRMRKENETLRGIMKSYVKQIAQGVLEKGLPEGVILNVNFPKLSKEDIKGIKICRQAKAMWQEEFDKRTNPQGKEYYWLTGKFVNQDKGTDTDEWALENGYISIVPVQFDLTAHHAIQQLNAWDL
jgi:hypothetical protein